MSGLVTLLRSILFILFEGGIHFVQLAGGLFEVSDSLPSPAPISGNLFVPNNTITTNSTMSKCGMLNKSI